MADIYSLNRAFWDFAFENTGKIKPNHIAVYQFSIEHCNRLGWKKQFGFPTSMVLDATGIKSYSVYKSTFDDLVNYGFFKVIEYSKNQYSSNIIALVENYKANSKANSKANDKALDKAFTKHMSKQHTKQCESTQESIDSIDKQIYNNTNLQNNKSTSLHPETKVSVTENLLFKKFVEIWFNFHFQKYEFNPAFKSIDGKKINSIIKKLETVSKERGYEFTDSIAEQGFLRFLTLAYSDDWLKANFELSNLDSKFNSIIQKSTNGATKQSNNEILREKVLNGII